MRRKAGEEPIYARRSFGNALPVSPADYDTSPHFGSSTPRYTIKKKYISKIEIDEKDFPDHLEPNNMPKSPSYTIRPRYHESSTSGIGYNYMPNKFGSDGLKKTIGHRIEQPHAVSYSSPDRYNTREKFGQATARYTIGRRLDEDKYNGNSSWVGLRGVDSPGPLYDSSIQPETFFARSPRFTIGEKPTDKKIKVKISRKARSEYNMPMSQLQNDLINDIKNDVLKASTIMSAVTKISANQASAKTKLKFVSGITVPNTRIREARPLPMKQILQYNEDEAIMQRAIRDRAKSDEVVEMFNTTQDGRIICLSDNYVSIFKKAPETATVKYEIENMYKYNQLNTIQAVDEILRFLAPPKGDLVTFRLEDSKKAKTAQMFISSMRNALIIGE